jgi:DNA-binding phage protein
MALTLNFKKTVVARVGRDPAFARALLDEAATLFLSGEPETARLVLRDLVNATLGFEQLAKVAAMPSKSLHRMLSPKGNPSMDNLAAIFGALRRRLKVGLLVHAVQRRKVPRARAMTTRRKSSKRKDSFAAGVGRGMRRAARTAREVARMYGTSICVWENGKVVAKDPNDDAK